MHPIIQRLKERKLVQWGLAYLAGAVALYSALDAFAEPWGVGSLQLRITQVALLVGFFIALTLAWYHGERGEQRVSGVELLILAAFSPLPVSIMARIILSLSRVLNALPKSLIVALFSAFNFFGLLIITVARLLLSSIRIFSKFICDYFINFLFLLET